MSSEIRFRYAITEIFFQKLTDAYTKVPVNDKIDEWWCLFLYIHGIKQ